MSANGDGLHGIPADPDYILEFVEDSDSMYMLF